MSLLGKRLFLEDELDLSEGWNEADLEIASTPFRTKSFAGYGFKPRVPDNIMRIQSKNSLERASFCILPSTSKPNEYLIKYKLVPREVPFDLGHLYSKLKSKPSPHPITNQDQKSSSNQAETSQRDSQQDRLARRTEDRAKVESYRFDKTIKNQEPMATRAKRKPAETGRKAQEQQFRRGYIQTKPVQPPKQFRPIASRPVQPVRILPKIPTPAPTPDHSPPSSPAKLSPPPEKQDCLQDPSAHFVPHPRAPDLPVAGDFDRPGREAPALQSFATRSDSIFREGRREADLKPSLQDRVESYELFRYSPAEVKESEDQEFIDSERLERAWQRRPVFCQVYMFRDMSIHHFEREVFRELHAIRSRHSEAALQELAQSIRAFQAARRPPKKLLRRYERFASFDKVLTNLLLDYPVALPHLEVLDEQERAMLVALSNAKFELVRKGCRLSACDSDMKIMVDINSALKDLLAEIYATFDAAQQTEAIYREFVSFLKFRKGVSMVLTLQQLEDESVYLLKALYEEHHRRLVRGKLEEFAGDFQEYLAAEALDGDSERSEAAAEDEAVAARYGLSLRELQFLRRFFGPETYAPS